MTFTLLDDKPEENLRRIKEIVRENGGNYFVNELNVYLSGRFRNGISINKKTGETLFYYRLHQHGGKTKTQISYTSRKKCGKFYGHIIPDGNYKNQSKFIIDEFEPNSSKTNILNVGLYKKRIVNSIVETGKLIGGQYSVIFSGAKTSQKLPLHKYNSLVTSAVQKIHDLCLEGSMLGFSQVAKWNNIVWQELSKLKHNPSEKEFWVYYYLVGRGNHSKLEDEIMNKYFNYEKCFHKYRIF